MSSLRLFHKIAALVIIATFLSVVLFGSISYFIFKDELIEARATEARSLAVFASDEIKNPLYFLKYDEMEETIKRIKENPNVESAYIMHADGRVITDGTDENVHISQIFTDDFTRRSIKSDDVLLEIHGSVMSVSSPITITEKIGILRIDFSLGELNLVLSSLTTNLGLIAIIICAFFVGAGFLFTRSLLNPIENVKNAAVEIAGGNLDKKIEVTSQDEVGQLASAFNEMGEKLKEAYTSLEQKVCERTDDLQKANLDLEFEVEVRRRMDHELKKAKDELELKVEERTHELKTAFDSLKSLDDLKRDIISNVTHEIRTPITIIKGALEILELEEDPEMRKRLINTSRDALKRQNMIVQDLIEAVKMQGGAISRELALSKLDVESILSLATIEFKASAFDKGIELISKIDRDLPPIRADQNKLKHVLRNLLSNAIKFTEGGRVTVKAKHKNDEIEFCVEDMGIGIAKGVHKSIFQPFFQIDSSPTRRYSGAGMGLPIAKNIINEHGGRMWVESTTGKGSRFYFTLPIDKEE